MFQSMNITNDKKENNAYIQDHNTGLVYKVMNDYLLQISPWEDGADRRVYEFTSHDYDIITYQNACMIVNRQFADTDENWTHRGKKYLARKIDSNRSEEEHLAMLEILPSHYINDTKKIMYDMPDGSVMGISDNIGNEFKMVKHKGKIYYMLIINQLLPKVKLYNTFGQFCQMVNIKNVKPIFNMTDKKYM